jgi:hypothetical protein
MVVTSIDERRHLSTLFKTGSSDDVIFTPHDDGAVSFFLHSDERVCLPFKFQSFQTGESQAILT